MTRFAICVAAALAAAGSAAGQLAPDAERATFRLPPGLVATAAAAEPGVVDPVSACFDHRGRMFVCEMRGYPNGGVGTGPETRGRVRVLTDRDGDGVYETVATFAAGLRFPMGVAPWKTGVIVAVAPDILFLDDADGDGVADTTTVLYTGFPLANIQQMVNSLQWAADGWIYGLAGNNAGVIRSGEVPAAPAVNLGSRGFRFRPGVPASLEPTGGGGQYGLTADPFGHWFTNTNSQHLRQVVVPDHYLRKNAAAAFPATTIDIAEHGPACRVFRVSPFEAWRVERTARRAGGADAKRFPANELVPGGFVTSGCSPLHYSAGLLPPAYRDSVFVCDPANNLVLRDVISPNGSVFTARRGEERKEFLASTDTWFRPVHQAVGPDGAVYVLDFYRETIETPISLPPDILAKLNVESRGRGRVWRIAPPGPPPERPAFAAADLPRLLTNANPWVRLTAQRLVLEAPPPGVAGRVRDLLPAAAGTDALPVLLGTLAALGGLPDAAIISALKDPLPGNREVALRLAEPRFATSQTLCDAAAALAADAVPMVRFQLALTAAFLPDGHRSAVATTLLAAPAADDWAFAACLCSAGGRVAGIVESLAKATPAVPAESLIRAAAAAGPGDVPAVLNLAAASTPAAAAAIFTGVGEADRGKTLPLAAAPAAVRAAAAAAFAAAAALPGRASAARLLAFAPYEIAAPALAAVLGPQSPPDVQMAAAKALGTHRHAAVGPALAAAYPAAGPAVKREILAQLLARPDRRAALLDAVEKAVVRVADIDPARAAALRAADPRAAKVLAATVPADRKAVLEQYRTVYELKPDAARGRVVYKTHCAACHKLGADGHDVGPNLLAVVGGKGTDDLLAAVFDPNREVDSRYLNYALEAADGRTLTGILAADGANAVTLRRADGGEDTVKRPDIVSLKSTGKSLMPDGLEKLVAPQDAADLFAFLRAAAAAPK